MASNFGNFNQNRNISYFFFPLNYFPFRFKIIDFLKTKITNKINQLVKH